jgi:hypothetical protein
VHEKTGEQNWIPLFDDKTGAPFFPVLMAELDTIKKTRIAGLVLRRDWGNQDPWPTWPTEGVIELSWMRHRVKQVIRAVQPKMKPIQHQSSIERPRRPAIQPDRLGANNKMVIQKVAQQWRRGIRLPQRSRGRSAFSGFPSV